MAHLAECVYDEDVAVISHSTCIIQMSQSDEEMYRSRHMQVDVGAVGGLVLMPS